MDKNAIDVMTSSKSDEYETPLWLFALLDDIFSFTLDPAASHASHMCEYYYTMAEDGLTKDWSNETWFVNPPYSRAKFWVDKAADELLSGSSEGVFLLPVRTETKYWHSSIWPVAHYVLFLKGRLKFTNRVTGLENVPAIFPSVLVFYTYRDMNIKDLSELNKLGRVINLWK